MSRDSFESLVENEETITILAEKWGKAVGCCFVSLLDRSAMVEMKTAYIDLIVVDSKHRRKGIGKALFQSVQKRAQKLGAKRMDLIVWSHNQIAVNAYASYGMVPQRYVYEMML